MAGRLINTSMSSRGWSYYQADAYCPALPFALGKQAIYPPGQPRQKVVEEEAPPLTMGTMGHVLQAHHLVKQGCRTGGCLVAGEWSEDPDEWLSPVDALDEWLSTNTYGQPYRQTLLKAFDSYLASYAVEAGRVLAIETEHFGVVGKKDGQWGYWTIDPLHSCFLRMPVSQHPDDGLLTVDGSTVVCSPLNVEGHPEHGYPVWMSRRSDADIERPDGSVVIRDHKHKGKVIRSELDDEYRWEEGFCAFRHLGSQVYGDRFAGLEIQAVQTRPPWSVVRVMLTPTPVRDGNFATLLWLRAHDKAAREVADPTGRMYRGWRGSSAACVDHWGKPCKGVSFCYGG